MDPELVAIAAGCLTTGAYVPQALKALRTRETHSLSMWMYVAMTLGLALWTVYGILVESPALIVANTVTLTLSILILTAKLRFG